MVKNKEEQTSPDVAGKGLHKVTLSELELAEAVHAAPAAVAQYLRVLRQNWRQGTVACKGRSDVAFSNRKPWKQKGTGRARAGSLRSPLWRKGGVIFGPQPRTRELTAPRALRRAVMASLLHEAVTQGRVFAFDIGHETPKTRVMQKWLQEANLAHKNVLLFVSMDDVHLHNSCANIPGVTMHLFDEPNGYALARAEYIAYVRKDATEFKDMVKKWI